MWTIEYRMWFVDKANDGWHWDAKIRCPMFSEKIWLREMGFQVESVMRMADCKALRFYGLKITAIKKDGKRYEGTPNKKNSRSIGQRLVVADPSTLVD